MSVRSTALLAVAVLVPAVVSAADLEDVLERAWVGAWVVTGVESASDCNGFFTNNEVRGTRVSSRGDRRFDAGELARVEKVNVKRSRIDLFLAIEAPILKPHRDGPFTLLDERRCKVQLLVDVPRDTVAKDDVVAANAALRAVATPFADRVEAEGSSAWNGRGPDRYPEDYEVTVARHAVWVAEERNADVARTAATALDGADRITERVRDDPDYLAGFAAGVEALRHWHTPSCDVLVRTSFASVERSAPRDRRGGDAASKAWRNGYRDGQELVFGVRVARAVGGCAVPVPPTP